jgi:hypothetical protein
MLGKSKGSTCIMHLRQLALLGIWGEAEMLEPAIAEIARLSVKAFGTKLVVSEKEKLDVREVQLKLLSSGCPWMRREHLTGWHGRVGHVGHAGFAL